MWEIVGLYTIPEDEMTRHMVVGQKNQAKANALLEQYLL